MTTATLLRDTAVGVVAGLAGAKVMQPATSKLYEHQTDAAKQQEEEASYGVAYDVAAEKTASTIGVELDDDQVARAGTALHYALGVAWAPIYMWLRRSRGYSPFGAGVAAGTSMYVLVDELANPLLGFTAPPKAYPLVTHLRGLAGHLVYGLGMAAVVEAGWRLLGGRPR
jgi:uncharacterized membrane protein YagU involved in acid resistance